MNGGWSLADELRRQNRERLLASSREESRTVPFGFSPRAMTKQIRLVTSQDRNDSRTADRIVAA